MGKGMEPSNTLPHTSTQGSWARNFGCIFFLFLFFCYFFCVVLGTRHYNDGDVYQGEWKDGCRHGKGSLTCELRIVCFHIALNELEIRLPFELIG